MPEYTVAEYTVVDIGEDRLGSVYPLVRTAIPDVSPQRWLVYARTWMKRGGILGLVGPDGLLLGFLTHHVISTLRHGLVLHVDNFVVFELGRLGAGRRALCEAAEARAREEGCAVLELRLGGRWCRSDECAKAATGWTSAGHMPDSILFVKSIEFTHAANVDERLAAAIDS